MYQFSFFVVILYVQKFYVCNIFEYISFYILWQTTTYVRNIFIQKNLKFNLTQLRFDQTRPKRPAGRCLDNRQKMLKFIYENILFQFYLLFTLRLKFVSPNFDHFLYVYLFFYLLFIDFEIMLSCHNLSQTIEKGYTDGNLRRRPITFSHKLPRFHLYLFFISVENYWLNYRPFLYVFSNVQAISPKLWLNLQNASI